MKTNQLERLNKLSEILEELIQETTDPDELAPMFTFEMWLAQWKRELEIKKFYNEN